jgi:hyperosmotically inducible protein
MKITRLVLLSAVLAAAVSSAQAAPQSQKGDSWVTAKTKIALFADPRVQGREINVETKSGVVMLRGKVENDEAKSAAETIAKSVDGASSVKNELQVVPSAKHEAVEVKDDVVTARVQAKLKSMPGAHIAVQTNAGVVSLTGDIDTVMHSAKASWTAWKVKGVKSVRNDLTVKP